MRRVSLLVVAFSLFAGALPLFAQENFTEGAVSRITLVRINPGHAAEFWQDVRQNLKPIYEEYKRQGVVVDYGFFTKATTEDTEDWNVGFRLTYQSYGAMDGLAAKTDPITLKFYGSRDARTAVMRSRAEHGRLISSFIVREVDPRSWAPAGTTPPRP